MNKLLSADLKFFKADSSFVGRFQKLISETVIPYQYKVLCDEVEGATESHVIKNFQDAARVLKGEEPAEGFRGMVFQDSDAAKWLEAAAYSLTVNPDAKLEERADELISLIASSQDSDGYLNTYYTIKDKEKRWTNLLEGHELYCSGHMIEAGCAYFEATGKKSLLEVCEKNADHIYNVFIENGHEGYPGHPEIELALLRLYEITEKEKYLSLAKHFIDVRGVDSDFYINEVKSRSWSVWGGDGRNKHYQQSYLPVREQKDAVGHSVRAVYLYTAMAHLASEQNDTGLYEASVTLWRSITEKRMYITGAIGSTCHGEAFTEDYDLPSDTAYAETCASIGLMFFSYRMLQNEIKGEYADVMERAFYNTVLAGMESDGKRFFYVNPLEVIPGITQKAVTHHHVLTQRPGWYTCACCPPNVARLVTSIGKYSYSEKGDTVYCHLYSGGEVSFRNGIKLKTETEYPYGFTVNFSIEGNGSFAVRVPSWSENTVFASDGCNISPEIKDGYAYFRINEKAEITMTLDSRAKILYPSSKIPTLSGMGAVMRGPLVYCAEGIDNNDDVLSLYLSAESEITAEKSDLLGGTVILRARGERRAESSSLYSDKKPSFKDEEITLVPYYLWGNRGETQMRVWLPVK